MKDLDIFSALDPAERDKVGALALKKTYRKNEYIFRDGEGADAIYLIKSGRVKLFKTSEDGKEFTLDFLKAEDIFGEATFFENAVQTINAVALEETFVCCCTKELFTMLLQSPQTSLKIIQHFGKKMNNYTEHMSRNAFKDVRGRILDVLSRLAETYGTPSQVGVTIAMDLTHQDIGSLVNASRVMVTNVLGEMRKENLIYIEGHRITLLTNDVASIRTLHQSHHSV
jgi:CRP/FNR family transcriptional regulator